MRTLQRSVVGMSAILAVGLVSVPAGAATMNGGVSTAGTTVVILPMGHLGDPANRFFQMFTKAAGAWRTSTPLGVGTNGGIIVSSPVQGLVAVPPWSNSNLTAVSELVAGFQHNLANGEVVPSVVVGPSSIATDPTSGVAAAVTIRGSVLRWDRADATPRRIGTTIGLAQSDVGRRCGLRSIDAVAVTTEGAVVVGGACTKAGVLGLFVRTPTGRWVPEGEVAAPSGTVMRLDADGTGVSGLWVQGGSTPRVASFNVSGGGAAAIGSGASSARQHRDGHLGVRLSLHDRSLRSTELVGSNGDGASGGPQNSYVVATASDRGVRAWRMQSASVNSVGPVLSGSTQVIIESAPMGAATFGGSPNITAFSVSAGTLRLSTLVPAGDRWVPSATIRVVIPYGSAQ